MALLPYFSCGTAGPSAGYPVIEYKDGDMTEYLHKIALRFAPRLYLHADEPYDIVAIIPVFHPERPVIAYHIFFANEVMPHRTVKDRQFLDNEILWIEYDPVTLKVSDVATYWHRTVLRTDTCVINANASFQRPSVHIQWGQHGILPLGWDKLTTARPGAELRLHYKLVSREMQRNILMRFIRGILMHRDDEPLIEFEGPFEKYIRFTKEVDAADYVKDHQIIVKEESFLDLESRFTQTTFSRKKEWPWW
ncbi:hypothetical protein ACFL6L_03450 [candidate division KSB1 bacterium]